MIAPNDFTHALTQAGIRFVTGVPDSLLKEVCACFTQNLPSDDHVIATNEGAAVALALGHYLATCQPALVYMQNSGLGNIVNPITSLVDPQVVGVPMLLMVGWRGEMQADGQQIHDEPQHVKQGQVTEQQLQLLDIPYQIIDAQTTDIAKLLQSLIAQAEARQGPVALLVRKQTFAKFVSTNINANPIINLLSRETVITSLMQVLPEDVPVVATTGMASRELHEYRKAQGHRNAGQDFLTVGGMGHASQIACGIAMQMPRRKVLCLDGDGAMLMHMGSLLLSAKQDNLIHVVINNGAHDSVGGQPTLAKGHDLTEIAKACGYGLCLNARTIFEVKASLLEALTYDGSCFIEVLCKCGAREDLGRPDRTPAQNKQAFMDFVEQVSIHYVAHHEVTREPI